MGPCATCRGCRPGRNAAPLTGIDGENGQGCRPKLNFPQPFVQRPRLLGNRRRGLSLLLDSASARPAAPYELEPSGLTLLQRPEPSGAAHAAGVPMLRRNNGRIRFLAENVLAQA